MEPKTRLIIGCAFIAVILGIYGVTEIVLNNADKELAAKNDRIHELTGQLKQLGEERVSILAKNVQIENDLSQKQAEVNTWKAKYESIKIPVKPNPPITDGEMSDSLVKAGLNPGLSLTQSVLFSLINAQDARKIWDWQQDSKLMPVILDKLDAANHVVSLQTENINLDKTLIVSLKELAKNQETTIGLNEDRFKSQNEKFDAFKKAAKAKEIKWYYKVAGAAVVGYAVGRVTK